VIAALLLAAGASRRFGASKLLQDIDGKPVLRWSAEALVGAPVDEIVVVIPVDGDALRAALTGIEARFVASEQARLGMASSLAAGVGVLTKDVEAALVALADEPMSNRSALVAVVDRFRAGDVEIVAPSFRGVRGHPVLFGRSVFDELRALSGDHGARAVVDRAPRRRAIVDIDAPKPIDVDTPDDLARLRGSAQFISPSRTQSP
jgi:molybdenum cofactor cytidylyltransferase